MTRLGTFEPKIRPQGEKFDPGGVYAWRWVPDLTLPPAGLIHQPWTATLEPAGAGAELGTTCLLPIIDHRAGCERALAACARIRNATMTSV